MAKEYIEREYLVKEAEAALDFRKKYYTDKARIADAASTVEWLKYYAPAADVVEVVRCRECKHWHEETGWCYHHSHFIKYGKYGEEFCHPWESSEWKMFDADYFCADGERRDNNAAD